MKYLEEDTSQRLLEEGTRKIKVQPASNHNRLTIPGLISDTDETQNLTQTLIQDQDQKQSKKPAHKWEKKTEVRNHRMRKPWKLSHVILQH